MKSIRFHMFRVACCAAALAPALALAQATMAQPAQQAAQQPAQQPIATLAAGATAPDFVMRDLNDKEVRLSDFKGKVVILDFWATWCGPCIASMPHTDEIAVKYADQGVVVVASGTSDKIDAFKKWIPKNQPKFPHLQFYFDPNERDSATFGERASSKLYGVPGIPAQFVIGRDGVITGTIVGFGGKDDARTEAALARAGVKVDAARVAAGENQFKAAAEEEADRLAAIEEERKNPTPQFYENYAKLQKGVAVPDFTAQAADGSAVRFSELTKGKTVVFTVWSAGSGIPAEMLAFQDDWSRRYADQGVRFVALGAYGSREDFDKWHAANATKLSFPVLFDPAGAAPRPAKAAMEEMNDEETKAFREATRTYFGKVIPMAFSGGAVAPVPHNCVIDAQGKFIGIYVGAGPQSAESLGNLLLRAGVKLAPGDMPKKVFTAEETKAKPPEAKVEMLKAGAMAPDFKATDAAGKEVKISDYRGKVVILDFWATWCGPCISSMPHTQQVAAQYKDQGVVVLASCTADDRKKFDAWVKRNQALYPDIHFSHDPQERSADRASHKLYGVGGIPQQFIIDREGRIVELVTGYIKGETLLDAALAKAGIGVNLSVTRWFTTK
jgi:peroxiredoxin